ncbi:MAG: ABC transporter ATP-binding protein/permease [Chloroflexi bacterium]|nr:ABC transporter ATP-binding protein/permease [Chloroflexota bacterium]
MKVEPVIQRIFSSIMLPYKYARTLTLAKIVHTIITAVAAPFTIYFTQRVIDAADALINTSIDSQNLLFWTVLLLASMLFVSIGSGYVNTVLNLAIRRKLEQYMTADILAKFRRIEYACYEDASLHDTLQLMTDNPQEKACQLLSTSMEMLETTISAVGAAVIFSQAGWWFALGFVVLIFPMIWLDFKSANIMNEMMGQQSKDERKMQYLGSLLSEKSSLLELKLFDSIKYIVDKWRSISRTVLDDRVRTTFRAQRYFLFSTALFKGWSLLIVIGLVLLVDRHAVTIGLFTAMIVSIGSVLSNSERLSYSIQNFRSRSLLMSHYHHFLDLPEWRNGTQKLTGNSIEIVFDHVYFTYPNTEIPVLKDISFTIRSGQRVAFVGVNGAGKTTIVRLICRLYRPDRGRILINNIEIDRLDQSELRKAISVVFQDFGKYSLTMRENIAFGDIDKLDNDQDILNASKLAMADNIAPLDAQLGRLSSDGIDLSGGQWQRVAIARAFLADSALVILDEPTASLDPIAESNLYQNYAILFKARGCILISHRLASARLADHIYVLHDGTIHESGSHDELMAANGLYARMYLEQSSWYSEKEAGDSS